MLEKRIPRRDARPLIIAALLVALAKAVFAVPAAGAHSAQPKYWPSVRRWVTNFSPFALQAGPIVGLSPDADGGLWFGIGQTVEHIDRSGRMTNYFITQDVYQSLWQVWDIARDSNGRRWFSLGQSGRIGTIDVTGKVRTQVLVARKFYSDIRTLRFAADGTLWFLDYGRRSIGQRTSNGVVTEIPMPDGALPVGLALCRGQAFVAAEGTYERAVPIDAMYAVAPGSLSLRLRHSWPNPRAYLRRGALSLACDERGTVWFAPAGTHATSTDGYIDRADRVHEQRSFLSNERMTDTPDGEVIITGARVSSDRNRPFARVAVIVKGANGTRDWMLPMSAEWFDNDAATGPDGTLWLAGYPYPITRLSIEP